MRWGEKKAAPVHSAATELLEEGINAVVRLQPQIIWAHVLVDALAIECETDLSRLPALPIAERLQDTLHFGRSLHFKDDLALVLISYSNAQRAVGLGLLGLGLDVIAGGRVTGYGRARSAKSGREQGNQGAGRASGISKSSTRIPRTGRPSCFQTATQILWE